MTRRYDFSPSPEHIRQEMRVFQAQPGFEVFRVPAWGYLEGFELMLPEPIANMDASAYLELEIRTRYNGHSFGGYRGFSLHRNVGQG